MIMRRTEKQVIDPAAIEAIIARAQVCRLGLCDQGQPYVVALCFGYAPGVFYLHSATEGRKIAVLRQNPRVCLQIDTDVEIKTAENPCSWGMRFKSVIGFGIADIVTDPDEKRRALDLIMAHYGGPPAAYPEKALEATTVIRVAIAEMTAKQSL
jgi:nitroimidazol reductase NimA-like FMN-containing flavoprotein (pyridoxamine 5'-phosphate oxidase superfamily)